jgi:Cu/Ag efflux protein CusF
MNRKLMAGIGLAVAVTFAAPLAAQSTEPVLLAQAKAAEMVDGEIRKIDKESGKLTIKHGEIKNLSMPPMTMVFRVKDAAMLDQVKAGDKIKFSADKIGGQYTVTGFEKAP